MPPPLLRKHCERCKKVFLTYESDKKFCTHTCEVKYTYCNHFNLKDRLKEATNTCCFCGEISRFPKFCSEICKKQHDKTERLKRSCENFLKEKKKKPRKKADFEASNLKAERARAFDDSYWRYRINREKI